jgi:uncharacterized protein YrzB (UPF0473 family)
MNNDNMIFVYDEEGNQIEMEVLFTFDADENDVRFKGNKYILFFNPNDENPMVQAARYIEKDDHAGSLEPIPESNIEEWEMIEEVYNAFVEDEEDDSEDEE